MTKKFKEYLNMTWIKYNKNIPSSSHSHAYQISSLLLRGRQKTTTEYWKFQFNYYFNMLGITFILWFLKQNPFKRCSKLIILEQNILFNVVYYNRCNFPNSNQTWFYMVQEFGFATYQTQTQIFKTHLLWVGKILEFGQPTKISRYIVYNIYWVYFYHLLKVFKIS